MTEPSDRKIKTRDHTPDRYKPSIAEQIAALVGAVKYKLTGGVRVHSRVGTRKRREKRAKNRVYRGSPAGTKMARRCHIESKRAFDGTMR